MIFDHESQEQFGEIAPLPEGVADFAAYKQEKASENFRLDNLLEDMREAAAEEDLVDFEAEARRARFEKIQGGSEAAPKPLRSAQDPDGPRMQTLGNFFSRALGEDQDYPEGA